MNQHLIFVIMLLLAAGGNFQHAFGQVQPNIRAGQDYALFFAVNAYKAPLTPLTKPIDNATDIARELKEKYGFATEIVKNPTLVDIENKLKEYENNFARNAGGKYPSQGQLFIFFTGHGMTFYEEGYFLPANADSQAPNRTALPYNLLRNLINSIHCRHVLVAIDACYSVTFDEQWKNKADFQFYRPGELSENEKILHNFQKYKSRVFYTSDGREDQTPDKSSFAKKLLEGLRTFTTTNGFMTSSELFANYVQKAFPVPHAGEFGDDEPGSTFLFFNAQPKPIVDPGQDKRAWEEANASHTLEGYRNYLRNFPQGEFTELAKKRADAMEAEKKDYNAWQQAKQNKDYEGYLRAFPNGAYREVAEEALRSNSLNPEMVLIAGGTFSMGSEEGESDEKPVHKVQVSDFYLGKYEVTLAEFKKFIDDSGYQTDAEKLGSTRVWNGKQWEDKKDIHWRHDADGKLRPVVEYNHPVIHVSWNDAVEYCKWLSKKTGKAYRLPTEAEWEYAAGNGSKHTKYSWGNGQPAGKQGGSLADETGAAQYNWTKNATNIFVGYTDGFASTAPVGSFAANELGVYDMSGNVWEWCNDWYASDYYAKSPGNNPSGPATGSSRVIRGGSWFSLPASVRVANRNYDTPASRINLVGFRLARAAVTF